MTPAIVHGINKTYVLFVVGVVGFLLAFKGNNMDEV